MASTIPAPIAMIAIAILILVVLAFLAWGLYNFHQVTSRDVNIGRNPYCIREGCTSGGTQVPAYQLSEYNDPQKFAYESISYCTINAMPCQLISGLQNCTTSNCTSITKSEIEPILSFYNKEYYPSCLYSWGNGVQATPGTNTLGGGSPSASNPNSPNLQYGPNDTSLTALLTAAGNLGLTPSNNSDVKGLCSQCYGCTNGTQSLSVCTGSS